MGDIFARLVSSILCIDCHKSILRLYILRKYEQAKIAYKAYKNKVSQIEVPASKYIFFGECIHKQTKHTSIDTDFISELYFFYIFESGLLPE